MQRKHYNTSYSKLKFELNLNSNRSKVFGSLCMDDVDTKYMIQVILCKKNHVKRSTITQVIAVQIWIEFEFKQTKKNFEIFVYIWYKQKVYGISDATQKELIELDQRFKRYGLRKLNLNLNKFKFKSLQKLKFFLFHVEVQNNASAWEKVSPCSDLGLKR